LSVRIFLNSASVESNSELCRFGGAAAAVVALFAGEAEAGLSSVGRELVSVEPFLNSPSIGICFSAR
jgi:hypothetical protein